VKLACLTGLVALALAGCAAPLTLEQARAQCTKAGGFLMVIYSQKVTATTVGPVVAAPGRCVSPSSFEKPAPAAPAAEAAPAAPPAPAAN